MRQIQQFVTENPKHLSTQLSKLEDNVAEETAAIRAGFISQFSVVKTDKGGGIYSVGQAACIDTAPGPLTINIANPPNNVPGLMIIVNQGANNLTIIPIAPTLINLATSKVAAFGFFWLLFDGANWSAT